MLINEAREAIYQYFVEQWGETTQITFDNEAFDTSNLTDSWVRLAVRNNTSIQETMGAEGGREYLRKGSTYIQVFTKVDDGMQKADILAEQLRDIFEGVSVSGIRFFDVLVKEGIEDSPWKQTLVEAQFEYNQRK